MFARAAGAEAVLLGQNTTSRVQPRLLSTPGMSTSFHTLRSRDHQRLERSGGPARRSARRAVRSVVDIGLAGHPHHRHRSLTLKDVTAVGILSASPALERPSTAFAAVTSTATAVATARARRGSAPCSPAATRPCGTGLKISVDRRASAIRSTSSRSTRTSAAHGCWGTPRRPGRRAVRARLRAAPACAKRSAARRRAPA